jgi:hypothetical protein
MRKQFKTSTEENGKDYIMYSQPQEDVCNGCIHEQKKTIMDKFRVKNMFMCFKNKSAVTDTGCYVCVCVFNSLRV